MDKESRIYIAGHTGLVGSAIRIRLEREGYKNLVFRKSRELDLRDQRATQEFFSQTKPEYVFLAAAKVGGIKANMEMPGRFIYDNLVIESNVIEASRVHGVKKLVFLGSNCMYPKDAEQPFKEAALLTSSPESTNLGYALAKLSGMVMCQAYSQQDGLCFVTVIPASLYGPNDHFDNEGSHLVPALISKFQRSKTDGNPVVSLWGTGKPLREIMHVDDAVDGILFIMEHYNNSDPINLGVGYDVSVKDLACLVKQIVGYQGEIFFDETKPDGITKKLLDSSKIATFGWRPKIELMQGLRDTYLAYLERIS